MTIILWANWLENSFEEKDVEKYIRELQFPIIFSKLLMSSNIKYRNYRKPLNRSFQRNLFTAKNPMSLFDYVL